MQLGRCRLQRGRPSRHAKPPMQLGGMSPYALAETLVKTNANHIMWTETEGKSTPTILASNTICSTGTPPRLHA